MGREAEGRVSIGMLIFHLTVAFSDETGMTICKITNRRCPETSIQWRAMQG